MSRFSESNVLRGQQGNAGQFREKPQTDSGLVLATDDVFSSDNDEVVVQIGTMDGLTYRPQQPALGGQQIPIADAQLTAQCYPTADRPLGAVHVDRSIYDAVRNHSQFVLRLGPGEKPNFSPVGKRVSEAIDRFTVGEGVTEVGPDRWEGDYSLDPYGMAALRQSPIGENLQADRRYSIRVSSNGPEDDRVTTVFLVPS
jgi:hypothetical protein